MTALDPSTADRVLVIPTSPFMSLPWGAGVTFAPHEVGDEGMVPSPDPYPVTITPLGNVGIDSSETYLFSPTPWVPTDNWTLIFAVEGLNTEDALAEVYQIADALGMSPVHSPPPAEPQVTVYTFGAHAGHPNPEFTPAPLNVFALTGNTAEAFAVSSGDGIIWTGTGGSADGLDAPMFMDLRQGAALVGMWLWEGQALSQADVLDTVAAIHSVLSGGSGPDPDPEPSAPSTIGPAYQSAVVQAVLGPSASEVMPNALWGAWLDDKLNVLAETGIELPQTVFGPTALGVANNVIIDGGPAPATVPAFFALMDAETGGEIVAYAPVTFDGDPSEGDPLAFAPGELAFNYGG